MTKAARAIVLAAAVAVALLPAGRARAVALGSRQALPPPAPCPGCWVPAPVTSWQWQLTGQIDQSVDAEMYDVDMFETPPSVVDQLHAAGRHVVCYIDAGTWEDWRPDAGQYPDSVKGKPNGWPGERWLDIRRLDVLGPILEARLDRCVSKGFDAVEFDNLDGYQNDTGFQLTADDQLTFNAWLANQAHAQGLSAALKNDLDQVTQLLPYFDWALDEQCFQYRECGRLAPFTSAGKAVMEVEYRLRISQFCPQANQRNFNSLKKHLRLDPYRVACR